MRTGFNIDVFVVSEESNIGTLRPLNIVPPWESAPLKVSLELCLLSEKTVPSSSMNMEMGSIIWKPKPVLFQMKVGWSQNEDTNDEILWWKVSLQSSNIEAIYWILIFPAFAFKMIKFTIFGHRPEYPLRRPFGRLSINQLSNSHFWIQYNLDLINGVHFPWAQPQDHNCPIIA